LGAFDRQRQRQGGVLSRGHCPRSREHLVAEGDDPFVERGAERFGGSIAGQRETTW
jgi:hypothetical protein